MITMRETLSLPELQSATVLTGKSGLSGNPLGSRN